MAYATSYGEPNEILRNTRTRFTFGAAGLEHRAPSSYKQHPDIHRQPVSSHRQQSLCFFRVSMDF